MEDPAVAVAAGFLAAILGSLLTRDPAAEAAYAELEVRTKSGVGVV